MNFRVLFLVVVFSAANPLSAVTVKIQDWLVEEFAQDSFDSQDICIVATDILDQINDEYLFDFENTNKKLREFDLAVLVSMNGDMIFLNRESYHQVIDHMGQMVPQAVDFEGEFITIYKNLSLEVLVDRITDALNVVQWRENLGRLVTAQLNPNDDNTPGGTHMDTDEFITLYMNRHN